MNKYLWSQLFKSYKYLIFKISLLLLSFEIILPKYLISLEFHWKTFLDGWPWIVNNSNFLIFKFKPEDLANNKISDNTAGICEIIYNLCCIFCHLISGAFITLTGLILTVYHWSSELNHHFIHFAMTRVRILYIQQCNCL